MARSADGSDGSAEDPTRTSDLPGDPTAPPLLDAGRFASGTVLAGRYRVVALLGRGGMGEVYRADDLKLRQSVALKLLPPGLAADPARLARFHNEVRLARQVSHPSVCRVHDIGESDGLTFLTMEYIDGEDLAGLLRRVGRLPAERAVAVARQICAGLGAAHERGVLHRDLKPANVMIDGRGTARLTDFGLAVVAGDAAADREGGGTPAYMAPEQIEGRPLSERSDVYALGLVLYELFTGRRAFEADSLAGLLEMRRSAQVPVPTSHVPDLDPRIERAILQCLEADPARRPPSAGAVAAALAGPDALAAAVAAGETPSPEMVAAAGEGVGLAPGVAVLFAALALSAQLIGAVLLDRAALVNRIPLDKPPEELAVRARAVLERAGLGGPVADQAYGFAHDRRYLRWLQGGASPGRWERLANGRPAAVRFWYRQSSRPLTPNNDALIITPTDPPVGPGASLVWLDTQGRLLELQAPPEATEPAPSQAQPDWDALIVEAGFEPGALEASSRTWLPPFFADRVAAYEGAFPGEPAIPLRVELAAYQGRPVAFRLRGPWDDATPPAAVAGSVMTGFTAVLIPVLLFALALARHNDRLGRSDRRGALRIAAFVFGCNVVDAVLRYGHAASLVRGWSLVADAVGAALFDAATAWLLYLALEPYVRRRWPEALVSWNRLLSGRFKDALVGRDLLIGGLASSLSLTVAALGLAAPGLGGAASPPLLLEAYLGFLAGTDRLLAWVFGFAAVISVIWGLASVLSLVLLKALLRSTAAAAAAYWLIWLSAAVPGLRLLYLGSVSPVHLLWSGVQIAFSTLVLVRHGLLAGIAYTFTLMLIECPALLRWGAWYARPSLLLYGILLAPLAWGLYAVLSARPIRWAELLER